MPKVYPPINSFNAGELSRLIEARFDVSKYASGCRTLENAMPLVEGGAKKMPGTYYAGPAASNTSKSRLVPFAFNTTQQYILEFSNEKIRFWKNGGLIVNQDPAGTLLGTSSTSITVSSGLIGTTLDFYTNPGASIVLNEPIELEGNTSEILGERVGAGSDSITVNRGLAGTTLNVTIYSSLFGGIPSSIEYVSNNIPTMNFKATVNSSSEIGRDTYSVNLTVTSVVGSGTDDDWTIYVPGFPGIAATVTGAVTSAEIVTSPTVYALGVSITVLAISGSGTGANWNVISQSSDYEVSLLAPYSEADIFELDVGTQSADTLYIFHHNYLPRKLTRSSDINWALASLNCTGAPTVANNVTQLPKYISNVVPSSSPIQITTYVPHGLVSLDIVYVNGLLGLNVGLNYQSYMVTVIDSTNFTIGNSSETAGESFTSGGGYIIKQVSLFSNEGDYPSCGTFYQQRLMMAGTDNNPQTIWGSVEGDYENFMSDPNEDDYGVQYTLSGGRMDVIRWIIGQTYLLIGTAGGLWEMSGGQLGNPAALTQSSVDANRQSTTGTGNVAPQIINDSMIWITRSARTVRLFQYDFVQNSFQGPDLTRINRQITQGSSAALSGIVQTAFQAEPYPILWAVRNDGQLLGMTYEKAEQVYAWFRVVTSGAIESVAVVSSDNAEDQVWIAVNRTINGSVSRCVEYFMPQEIYNSLSNAFFVHCGLQWHGSGPFSITGITKANPCVVTATGHTFSGGQKITISGVQGMTQVNLDPASAYVVSEVSGNTFQLTGIDSTGWGAYTSGGIAQQVTNDVSGMTYLMGEEVVAVGDGALIYQGTVTADMVSFPYYSNIIIIGLPYTTTIEPMNPILAAGGSVSRGKKQKINRVTLCLYETAGNVQYGRDTGHLFKLPLGNGGDPQLVTDDFTKDLAGDWDDKASISIVHSDPLPFTLKAVIPRLSIAEEG